MRPVMRTLGRIAGPGADIVTRARRAPSFRVVGWHRIDTGHGAGGDGLSTPIADFERQLDVIDSSGAEVLGLAEAVARTAAGTLPERAVVLTFDDGYASVIEEAWPRLRARGMPATFFVTSAYVGSSQRFPWDRDPRIPDDLVRLVDESDLLAAAAEGLDIGSHTVTHPWLPTLPAPELERELVESRCRLEDLLGVPVTSLAYPTGGWSGAVRDVAERAGYETAITVDRGVNQIGRDPLALRREFAFDRPEDFAGQLRGAFDWMRPVEWWRRRGGPPC